MVFETWLKSDLKQPLVVEKLQGNFFSGDVEANLVGVEVFDNGSPATLSGQVLGYLIRADGGTVIIEGTLSGNKASILLPSYALNIPGWMSIVIKVGSVSVGACTVYVYRSTTDELLDPEHIIPSIEELFEMIEECEQAVQTKADKVTNATNNHIALLDANGNLKDSGKYTTDFLVSTLKGANNGVAELDINGKVPSSQLPSYVDDVLEYDSLSAFPATGETGKIYVAKDTNKTYRWSGSAYVEISPSLALGETSSTAYRGDRGKTAYDHATDSGRITTATASGFYKIAVTSEGHVAGASAVTKSDLTSLGVYEKPANGIPATDLEESYIEEPSVAGTSGQVLTSDGQGGQSWQTPSSGVTDYTLLSNKPSINSVTLTGDKTLSDLGIASEADLDDKLDKPSVAGTMGQVLTSNGVGGQEWVTPSSGSSDYTDLSNKPSINSVTLSGNKTSADLGVLSAPSTAGTSGQVLTSDGQGGATWQTPSGGTVTDVQEDGVSILSSGVANILTMTGASSSSAGTKGLVPAPSSGEQNLVLTGAGSWQVSPGAKLYTVSGTMTGTTLTISDDYITADMKCIMIEIGTPSAFDDKITATTANGSVTISCTTFSGSSTVTATLQKVIADPLTVTSTEFDVLNNRIGDLTTLTTTAKTSAVSAINEVDASFGGLKMEHFDNLSLTFNNQNAKGIARTAINGGDNHILTCKALIGYVPGYFFDVTTDSGRANVVFRENSAITATITNASLIVFY